MRNIPAALQARLDTGVTKLAQAWRITRRDGAVLGFTDHDGDLVIDGVTFRAGTGFGASEASARFDLSVDGGEIAGALDDELLTEADLAAGRFDAASIETWLVDWSDVSLKVLVARGRLGELTLECAALWAVLMHEFWTGDIQTINALVNVTALLVTYWGFRFGVLGVYISGRTREKVSAVTGQDAPGMIERVIKAVVKKK